MVKRVNPKSGKPALAVNLGGIRMKNPVMVASGTFGYGPEYADLVDLEELGGIVVKGIHIRPWEGNPVPRMVEVAGGLVNAIGLQNPGADLFIRDYMPFLRRYDVAVIVNIWGRTVDEYAQVAERFDGVKGVSGLEVNISCPNIKEGGIAFGTDPRMAARVIRAVRRVTRLPVMPKLSPGARSIPEMAKAVEGAGADAISLINTIPAMVIDIERRRPVLANGVGGLSGPAIHPVAVRMVWEAARAVKIPVVGMGGISEAQDAIEFLIAGASAVAVGTATFGDPEASIRVRDGIIDYLRRHRLAGVSDLVGSIRV